MGGDRGPSAVVAGLSHSAKKNDRIAFILEDTAVDVLVTENM